MGLLQVALSDIKNALPIDLTGNRIPTIRRLETRNQTVQHLSCQRRRTRRLGLGIFIGFSFRKDIEINVDIFFFKVVKIGELPIPDSRPVDAFIKHKGMVFQKQGSFFLHAQMSCHFMKIRQIVPPKVLVKGINLPEQSCLS